jgi:hypothetical protein
LEYSISKCDPTIWDLLGFLRSNEREQVWTIIKTAKPGDILFLGLSGTHAGIYAVGKVISQPRLMTTTVTPYTVDLTWPGKAKWRSRIRIIKSLINSPVLEAQLRQNPDLVRIADWLHIQGTSTSLSPEQSIAIKKLANLSL